MIWDQACITLHMTYNTTVLQVPHVINVILHFITLKSHTFYQLTYNYNALWNK